MIKLVCWNARSINTRATLERLQKLKNYHNLSMIIILEPFIDDSQIQFYKSQPHMDRLFVMAMGRFGCFGIRILSVKSWVMMSNRLPVSFNIKPDQ